MLIDKQHIVECDGCPGTTQIRQEQFDDLHITVIILCEQCSDTGETLVGVPYRDPGEGEYKEEMKRLHEARRTQCDSCDIEIAISTIDEPLYKGCTVVLCPKCAGYSGQFY